MDKELRRLIKNKAVSNSRLVPKVSYDMLRFLESIADIAIEHYKRTQPRRPEPTEPSFHCEHPRIGFEE